MSCHVWHVRIDEPEIRQAWLRFQFSEEGVKPLFPSDYEHVATIDTVDTEDIDDVFSLTNTIDSAWYDNKSITVIKRTRSTSIGDVIVNGNGEAWRCERVGWSKVDLNAEHRQVPEVVP